MKSQKPLIIISGPSGSGEDSIIEGLAKRMPIERVITTTTRDKRHGERDGHPYYFISKDAFERGISEGAFFEYAQHYNDQYYGVTFEEIKRVEHSGKVGIWKIDYKGVQKAKELMPDVLAIFIYAPLDVLEARLRKRDTVTDAYIEERMAYTKEWFMHTDIYDITVENVEGKLIETIDQVEEIIRGAADQQSR
jgi:guanylate kinase